MEKSNLAKKSHSASIIWLDKGQRSRWAMREKIINIWMPWKRKCKKRGAPLKKIQSQQQP